MRERHVVSIFRKALLALTLCAVASWAQAALFEDDEARKAILALREQMTATQKSLIDLQNQLDELQKTNSQLRGTNEVLEKRLQELTDQQKAFYQDIHQRLKRFEPQIVEIEGVQGEVQPGEKDAYEAALKAFQDGNLKKSDAAFDAFVKKYADTSPYWPLAQFWLGNSNYAQKDYKGAISALNAMLKRYPLHARGSDAMLTLANAQIESGQKSVGKKTLESLIEKYGESEAANLAKQTLKRLK